MLRTIMSGAFLIFAAACGGNEALSPSVDAPSTNTPPPVDTASTPVDTGTTTAPTDSLTPPDTTGFSGAVGAIDNRSSLPGIVFASGDMDNQYLNTVHTGSKRGGGLTPENIIPLLNEARARGGRLILKLCLGRDSYVKNPDGTFSLTKWKELVGRFRSVNLTPYINDGTIVGHFLVDEPHRTAKWGGKIIPQATVEAMAQYSKQLWPTLTTFVHTKTDWLVNTPVTYRYLDAGWAQYAIGKGEVNSWIVSEIALAKRKGLGLVIGMNVIAGSNANGGIRGYYPGYYAMSATQLKSWGTALLNQSYGCAFFMWQYNSSYYNRTDIKAAMAALSLKAKAHPKTSCQQ
ncbi:MAG: hypothetical protein ACJ8A6_12165 [Gemmatimonadales bacterium]